MDAIRIANCSGFYGDRLSAAEEMVEGGPIDVLTGDYLAELTMAILWRSRSRDPALGYATTFLDQMEQVLGRCLDRGIKVVANAGGLNPKGLAERLVDLADRLGLSPRVAYVEGDDLMPRLDELLEAGIDLRHLDDGRAFTEAGVQALTANAYLGGWGIAAALDRGADVVVTGRVTDASLVVGPAAWQFGWGTTDWDRLAGAVVAGHIVECGAHCTGGNYSFFDEVTGLSHCGFPVTEVYEDGSSVITKHPGTGGQVSVGTVTAQLLYEIDGPGYLNPDVVARFDTIRLEQEAPDRVRVAGVRGEPPPPTTKVGINYFGGYRNSMTMVLAGLDIEEKANLAEGTLWHALGGREQFAATDVRLIRYDKPNPPTNEEAFAHLQVTVFDPDPARVGRTFSAKVVEQALAGYPGFTLTTPPGKESPFAVFWPAAVPSGLVWQRVVLPDDEATVESTLPPPEPIHVEVEWHGDFSAPAGPVVDAPLGTICGARSGDKGGNANLGVWVRSAEAYGWLTEFLTVDELRRVIPESRDIEIRRYELPNLLALNFVLIGLLGEGVAGSPRPDPQAKTLGEYLRAKVVGIPATLIS